MLYWLTGDRAPRRPASTGRASGYVSWRFTEPIADTVDVPTGCSVFPREVPAAVAALGRAALHRHPPLGRARRAAATSPPSSSPALFVDELRAFFRLVR